jgi:hypothetical protein
LSPSRSRHRAARTFPIFRLTHRARHMRRAVSNMITEIPISTETLCVYDVRNFRQDRSFRDQASGMTGLARFRLILS